MGSVNDNIQAALSPIYGAKSTNHLIRLFRTDHGLLENDRWQAYLQGTPLSDLTGLSPVGSLADIERLLFENFAELHNESTGLFLPGTSGNYVSTPDHADIRVTGDICLIVKIQMDWTPAVAAGLLGKSESTGNQQSYALYITTTGFLYFYCSSTGAFESPALSTAAVPFMDELIYLAVTFDSDNGSSQHVTTFWYSLDGQSWTKLGNPIVRAGVKAIYPSTAPLEFGSIDASIVNTGVHHYCAVYDGIGDNSAPGLGTLVAEFDASAPVGPRYRDRTGKIWTINGSAWSWE